MHQHAGIDDDNVVWLCIAGISTQSIPGIPTSGFAPVQSCILSVLPALPVSVRLPDGKSGERRDAGIDTSTLDLSLSTGHRGHAAE